MRRRKKIELTVEERDAIWNEAEAYIDGAIAHNAAPTPKLLKYQSVCKLAAHTESLRLAQKMADSQRLSEMPQ